MKNLHQTIRNLRHLHSLSIMQMAEKLNMDRKTYELIEKGTTQLTDDRIRKIAAIFGMTPAELYTFEDNIEDT